MAGLTLYSGALIKYEDQDATVRAWLDKASKAGPPPIVPAVVLAEAWRGGQRSARVGRLLKQCRVKSITDELAREAGLLIGAVGGNATIDAIVVVVAAQRGDIIITSDPRDLTALVTRYPTVSIRVV